MVECGTIPRIRHVQGECLMYNSVQGLLSMVEYGKIPRITVGNSMPTDTLFCRPHPRF